MVVKRIFCCLKRRWRIISKQTNVFFKNLYDLDILCICLHNLCIIHGDGFNMQWAAEAKKDTRDSTNLDFGNLLQTIHDIFYTYNCKGIDKINENNIIATLKGYIVGILHYDGEDPDTLTNTEENKSSESNKNKDDQIKKMLKDATIQHKHMTLNNWRLHLVRENIITFDKAFDFEYI